jgi:cell division protein FtsI (penicillin-binding protein 3)
VARIAGKSQALHSATLEGGSAAFARVPSVATGGKTGTAQAITADGRYSPAEYVTLFAGFFPVENPKYVVIVAVDQATLPPKLNSGGLVAAPIFAEITKKISTLPSK